MTIKPDKLIKFSNINKKYKEHIYCDQCSHVFRIKTQKLWFIWGTKNKLFLVKVTCPQCKNVLDDYDWIRIRAEHLKTDWYHGNKKSGKLTTKVRKDLCCE